jgi:heat shock protein HslJ
LAVAFVAFLVAGCGGSDAPASLADSSWTLASLNGAEPVAGTTVTAKFTADQVSGSGGCNNYFGSYETDRGDLSFGPLGSTFKACAEPISRQEAEYFAALQAATSYGIDGDELTITYPDGTLTFERS